ncbi:MAG: recombinase family protein [Deltaproteobacteria bacterium]|nr:recombinase family protein [Deltaproteobacteria bacterium]
MGRAMLSFAIEFSQLERELTAERVKASYTARAGRGLWTGGPIPFGLEKSARNGYLIVNPAKQIIATEIFNIVIHKARDIATAVDLVNQSGYYGEHGKTWDHKSLPTWIRHPALAGEIHMNRDAKDQNQESMPESERFKVIPAVWEPVVNPDMWLAANKILDERYGELKVGNWKHHDFFLSKILLCPEGKRLTGASGTGGGGTKYSHYRHSGNVECLCHIRTIPARKIETKVLDELKKLLLQPGIIADLAKNANRSYSETLPNLSVTIAELTQKSAKLEAKLGLIADQVLDSKDDSQKAIWNAQLQRVQRERLGYEKQIESLQTRQKTQIQNLDPKRIEKAIEDLIANFDILDGRCKHLMISSIVDRVDIKRDSIGIAIKNPLNQLDVNQGMKMFYSEEEWLLRTDSNRRPGG